MTSENPWIEDTVRVETFDGQVSEVVTSRRPNPEYWRDRLEIPRHTEQYEQRLTPQKRILILACREVDAQRWRYWAGFTGRFSHLAHYAARWEDLRVRYEHAWEIVRIDGWEYRLTEAHRGILRLNFPNWLDSCEFDYSERMMGFELVGGSEDRIGVWQELRSLIASNSITIPRQLTATEVELERMQRQIEVRRCSAILGIDAARPQPHTCSCCAYFVPQPFNTCNAFHQPENYYQETDCPDWELRTLIQ